MFALCCLATMPKTRAVEIIPIILVCCKYRLFSLAVFDFVSSMPVSVTCFYKIKVCMQNFMQPYASDPIELHAFLGYPVFHSAAVHM